MARNAGLALRRRFSFLAKRPSCRVCGGGVSEPDLRKRGIFAQVCQKCQREKENGK